MKPVIHNMDVLASKGLFPAVSADTILMDMPYRWQYGNARGRSDMTKYLHMASFLAKEAMRILKAGGNLVIVNTTTNCYAIHQCFIDAGFHFRAEAVCKKSVTLIRKDGLAIDNDKVLFYYKGSPENWYNQDLLGHRGRRYKLQDGNQFSSDWSDIPNVNGYTNNRIHMKHPEAMNEAVAERAIMLTTRPGQTLVEYFSGAGTGVVVCMKYGIKYMGVEGNPEYIKLINARVTDLKKGRSRYATGNKYSKVNTRLIYMQVERTPGPDQSGAWETFCEKHNRKNQKPRPRTAQLKQPTVKRPGPYDLDEMRRIVASEHFGNLPETERDIITWLLESVPQKEIASRLGLTQGAISSRLTKAMRRSRFMATLPVLGTGDWEILAEHFDPVTVTLIKTMVKTTCQSKTADVLNLAFPNRGTFNQIKVRYRWLQALELLKDAKIPALGEMLKVMEAVQANMNMLHEVVFPTRAPMRKAA